MVLFSYSQLPHLSSKKCTSQTFHKLLAIVLLRKWHTHFLLFIHTRIYLNIIESCYTNGFIVMIKDLICHERLNNIVILNISYTLRLFARYLYWRTCVQNDKKICKHLKERFLFAKIWHLYLYKYVYAHKKSWKLIYIRFPSHIFLANWLTIMMTYL